MSAATPPAAGDQRPGLARLSRVEMRKMTDTRAGLWLHLAVIALTILVVGLLVGFAEPGDRTLRGVLEAAVQPASILLPIVGILLVSSEWTQRTALVTFTLVPDRRRVLLAKLGAGVALAVVALVLCAIVSLIALAARPPGLAEDWSLPPWLVGQVALSLVTSMIMGVGLGAAFLRSAPAIVTYFLAPIAVAAVGAIRAIEDIVLWVDASRSLSPLTDHAMSGIEWARAGTTLAVWMLLPVLIGLWRILRTDIQAT